MFGSSSSSSSACCVASLLPWQRHGGNNAGYRRNMFQDAAKDNRVNEEAKKRLLKQVDSFRRRYNSLYPSGPLLLLSPRNENNKVVSYY